MYQYIVGFRNGYIILALVVHISVHSQRSRMLLRERLCATNRLTSEAGEKGLAFFSLWVEQ